MAGQKPYPSLEALRKLEASLNGHLREQPDGSHVQDHEDACAEHVPPPAAKARRWFSRSDPFDRQMRLMLWWPRVRKLVLVGGTAGSLALIGMGALWWRLSSGPIELDVA